MVLETIGVASGIWVSSEIFGNSIPLVLGGDGVAPGIGVSEEPNLKARANPTALTNPLNPFLT